MDFFNCAQYTPQMQDNSWCGQAEAWADVCRGPRRWLAGELLGEGKKYVITQTNPNQFKAEEIKPDQTQGLQKVLRIVIGVFLGIVGELCAVPLMAFAFTSEEIRLKHKVVSRPLNEEDKRKLADLIQERQKLDQQRQGCEPVSCLLFSICCLLCYLVCYK